MKENFSSNRKKLLAQPQKGSKSHLPRKISKSPSVKRLEKEAKSEANYGKTALFQKV